MTILETHNLTKTYEQGELEINALVDLTLAIEPGEFVAVMGASGSGKSTLLNLLGGLDQATSGRIPIDGKQINERRGGRHHFERLWLVAPPLILMAASLVRYKPKTLEAYNGQIVILVMGVIVISSWLLRSTPPLGRRAYGSCRR